MYSLAKIFAKSHLSFIPTMHTVNISKSSCEINKIVLKGKTFK